MEYQINEIPFKMNEIPAKLFNSPFLSDITFVIEDKPIYGHSFELMVRSNKFLQQLPPIVAFGDDRTISITKYRYAAFYQFIRFIYTDECDMHDDTWEELLELAKEYQIIRLMNFVQISKGLEMEIDDMPCEMKDVSNKLFGLEFLSDVTFVIEDREIYAHSLELMKRSTVFQRQLELTLNEKKIIPINDCRYDVFYQFVRFIYTDECQIDEPNIVELLKLAMDYRVIGLLNVIHNHNCVHLKMPDSCVVANFEFMWKYIKCKIVPLPLAPIQNSTFTYLNLLRVKEILTLENMANCELDIIRSLVGWMINQSIENKTSFSEWRVKYDELISLIRFPTLTNQELEYIKAEYPALLTKHDFEHIGGQKILGIGYENGIWNCRRRSDIENKKCLLKRFEIKFSVNSDLILAGFVCRAGHYRCIKIEISCENSDLDEIPIDFNVSRMDRNVEWHSLFINLGSSIRIRSNFRYTIGCECILYDLFDVVFGREPKSDIVVDAPPDTVNILQDDGIMEAIMFLQPDDCI